MRLADVEVAHAAALFVLRLLFHVDGRLEGTARFVCVRDCQLGANASNTQDRGKTITLLDDDADAVGEMLRFVYTYDYEYGFSKESPALTDLRIHGLAEKYDMSGLVRLAEDRFAANIRATWKREEFVTAIEKVYTRTMDRDGKLNAAILDVAIFHAKELFEADFGAAFRRMSKSLPAFSSEMSARLAWMLERAGTQPFIVLFKCKCGQSWAQTASQGWQEGVYHESCSVCQATVKADFPAVSRSGAVSGV